MNRLTLRILITCLWLLAPGLALAAIENDGFDCASATELSPGTTYSGSTADSTNFIPGIGPYPSPGKDRVYTFTAGGTTGPISINAATYQFAVFVTDTCAPVASPPLAAAAGALPTQINLPSLVPGQRYYLIVTGDPTASADIEGAYSLSTSWIGPEGNGDGGTACTSATELESGGTYSGNTTYSSNFIAGIGPYSNSAKEHVYTFTATEASGPISIDWASYDFAAFVTTDCASLTTGLITLATGPAPTQLDLSALESGHRYYLIVSGISSATTLDEGAYSLSTGWLAPNGNDDGGLDCSSATELFPDRVYVGDTSYAGNPIAFIGPTPNASSDHIYRFTASETSWMLAIEWANYDFFAFVTDTCNTKAPIPTIIASSKAPAYLDLSGLVPGKRYYVVISGTEPIAPGVQGAYIIGTPWAKAYVSDDIFGSGFE